MRTDTVGQEITDQGVPAGEIGTSRTPDQNGTTTIPTESVAEERVLPKRLYRSRRERLIAGVCGGLAEHFNVDPVLVRAAFVLFGLISGAGLLAYVILWIIVPERPVGVAAPPIRSSIDTKRGREVVGFVLLAVGLLLLAGNLGVTRLYYWDRLWPLILVVFGLAILFRRGSSD